MAQEKKFSPQGRITLLDARIRFSGGLFTASSPPNTSAPPAFNVKLILAPTHPQLARVKELIEMAGVNTFKARAKQVMEQAAAAGKICLRAGNLLTAKDGTVYAGFEGNFVLSARSPHRPTIIGSDRMPIHDCTQANSRIYDGCYVNAQVDIFGYTKGSNGVSARIVAVQFSRDGEALGGGMPVTTDDFGVVEETAKAEKEFGDLFGGL
jgi:hypothetical protein